MTLQRSVARLVALTAMTTSVGRAAARPVSEADLLALRPGQHQAISSKFLLRLLDDPRLARRILAEGTYVRRAGRYLVRTRLRHKKAEPATLFRITIELEGYPAVEALFKPRQRGYRDWATETAICRLAGSLGVRVPPCYERSVPRRVLAEAVSRLPAAYRDRLIWDSPNGDRIFGFFRLWAPNFTHRLGAIEMTRSVLISTSKLMRARHRKAVLADPVLLEFPDLLVFDFLIYNNDRANNLGTLRISDTGLVLFPIDYGDGLTADPHNKLTCRALLENTALFRRKLIDRIRALTRAEVVQILTHAKYGLLVPASKIDWLMRQRQDILDHVERVVARDGANALF